MEFAFLSVAFSIARCKLRNSAHYPKWKELSLWYLSITFRFYCYRSLYTLVRAPRIRVSESLGSENKPKCKLVNGVINTQTNKHLQWSEVKSPPLSVTLCMRERYECGCGDCYWCCCDVFSLYQRYIYEKEMLCIVTNHTAVWPQTNFKICERIILFFFKFPCWKSFGNWRLIKLWNRDFNYTGLI